MCLLPLVISSLKILFFLLAFWVVLALLYYGRTVASEKPAAAGSPARLIFRIVWILFVGVYLYQGSWQLAGFARPAFMDFMRTYSRRPNNPAKELSRGRILDRNGVELARNNPSDNRLRTYPYGRAFCHLVGYLDPMFGLSGLEAADSAFLSGYSLASRDEFDRFSRNILDHHRAEGNDLLLTLDARLQKTAADLLKNRRGAIVAIRPGDSALLVLASAPSFDPENLDTPLSDNGTGASPLLNRAVQGLYPPGSTFKMVVAAVALEQGFSGQLDCPAGGYAPPGPVHRPIRDHEFYEYKRKGEAWTGWGRIGLDEAFARSSNVFFAQLGIKLGSALLNEKAQRFLFNEQLVLFEGSSGSLLVKPSTWPALHEHELNTLAQQSIGQGAMLVTPLHMALITAAIARDGELYYPRVAVRTPPRLHSRLMSHAVAAQLKHLMRLTVERGTASAANLPGLAIAGKTGTAQASEGEDHSWFVCFAPLDRPALAIAVLIEHGGYGAASALPIAVELIRKAKQLGLLEQDTFSQQPEALHKPQVKKKK